MSPCSVLKRFELKVFIEALVDLEMMTETSTFLHCVLSLMPVLVGHEIYMVCECLILKNICQHRKASIFIAKALAIDDRFLVTISTFFLCLLGTHPLSPKKYGF